MVDWKACNETESVLRSVFRVSILDPITNKITNTQPDMGLDSNMITCLADVNPWDGLTQTFVYCLSIS